MKKVNFEKSKRKKVYDNEINDALCSHLLPMPPTPK